MPRLFLTVGNRADGCQEKPLSEKDYSKVAQYCREEKGYPEKGSPKSREKENHGREKSFEKEGCKENDCKEKSSQEESCQKNFRQE